MLTHLVTVGDELLSGRTVNSNAASIGRALWPLGAPVGRVMVVADRADQIAAAVAEAVSAAQVVIVTGGLGPTHDDVTVDGVASGLRLETRFDAGVFATIQSWYRQRGRAAPEGARKMAFLPVGAAALENARGTAPGLYIPHQGRHVFVLPGVPHELHGILHGSVIPMLSRLEGRVPIHTRSLATAGISESRLAELLSDLIPAGDRAVRMAFLPGYGGVELRLSAEGETAELEALASAVRDRLGSDYVADAAVEDLLGLVCRQLRELRLTLATAESCTGGLLGKMITDRPGASAFYRGGIIAYSDLMKESLLAVPPALLSAHGAVSVEVAAAMADGARARFDCSVALSITGIAGPGGATPLKPVGLIFLGVSGAAGTRTRRLHLPADREQNRERSAFAAVDFLRRYLAGTLE